MGGLAPAKRLCGSTLTVDGRPCRNEIKHGDLMCRDRHPLRGATAPLILAPSVTSRLHETTAQTQVEELYSLAKNGDTQAARIMVRRQEATPEMLQWAVQHGDSKIKAAVARHINCTKRMREELARGSTPAVHMSLLSSRHTGLTTLRRAVGATNSTAALVQMAGNPNCDVGTLRSFLASPIPEIRRAALANANCPADVRRSFSGNDLHDQQDRALASLGDVVGRKSGLSFLNS